MECFHCARMGLFSQKDFAQLQMIESNGIDPMLRIRSTESQIAKRVHSTIIKKQKKEVRSNRERKISTKVK